MQYITLSSRQDLQFDLSGNLSKPNQNKNSDTEQRNQRSIKLFDNKRNQQENSPIETRHQYKSKNSKQKELAHADSIQRFIRESSFNGRQRQRSNSSKTYNSDTIDDVLDDENNDWFFEKILEKFEEIRTKKVHGYQRSRSNDFNSGIVSGPERIIERRYYVKKTGSLSKCNRLTSTTELKQNKNGKIRQISGVSSATTCSQCLSSAPMSVENVIYESNLLRNEISNLRDDIAQLQTCQEKYFKQIEAKFQSNRNATTTASENLHQATIVTEQILPEKVQTPKTTDVPLSKDKRTPSISTASIASNTTVSSDYSSDEALKPLNKTNVTASNKSTVQAPPIAEFTATKNSAISPVPQIKEHAHMKNSSTTPSPRIAEFIATKNSSIPPTPPATQPIKTTSPKNVYNDSKHSSAASTPTNTKVAPRRSPSTESEVSQKILTRPIQLKPPINSNINSQSQSIKPTPPANQSVTQKNQSITSVVQNNNTYNGSRSSSAASTPTNTKVPQRHSPSTDSEVSQKIVTRPTQLKPPINSNINSQSQSTIPTPPANQSVTQNNQSITTTTQKNAYNKSESSSAASTPTNVKVAPRQSSSSDSESSITITAVPLLTKPPLIPRTASVNTSNVSQSPSIVTKQPINNPAISTSPSIAATPPPNSYVGSKPLSEMPISSMTQFIASKTQSTVNRSTSSVGPATSSTALSLPVPSTSSTQSVAKPIYENELAHRRVLSPRSQIVASAASAASTHESSDSSAGSTSPELVYSTPKKITKITRTTLQDNELQALAQYSSQLELSGFPPSTTPVIYNPNNSSTFWESVDQYVENYKSTNSVTALTTMPRTTDENTYTLNNSIKKLLDKYNLEIKPQGTIQSSAPLLMPPLDTLP